MSRRLLAFALLAGLLPVLPMLILGSPVLNNDMLVAYFCYFWDFHRNWSWDHPLVFWSSSYQTGMPMHAYWQSGFLYPLTWILFGPLSPHLGIHLFYAFHFSLGIIGFVKLGPRLGLKRPASLWAGLAFALSGTMLARYEHATFLSGWAWLPLVLNAFLALRDAPGPRNLLLYALAVCLQALGGHPQASATTAVLIGIFTVAAPFRRPRASTPGSLPVTGSSQVDPAPADRASTAADQVPAAADQVPAAADRQSAPAAPEPVPVDRAPAADLSRPRRFGWAGWLVAGHVIALVYCLPLVLPFLELVSRTDRFDGVALEDGGSPGAAAYSDRRSGDSDRRSGDSASPAQDRSAAAKLEEGVFGFRKFSTGGMRPLHLASLFAAHALGTPSNASWWGGEAWGEVFVYFGVLGLFFCLFASWKRAGPDLRLLWAVGLLGLWFAFGAHLGASQILYEVPGFNNFRRPARYLILFVFAFAALSAHGYQRWSGKPRDRRVPLVLGIAGLFGAALFLALRLLPEAGAALLDAVQAVKRLDPAKDYAGKISALAGRLAWDGLFTVLSACALGWAAAPGISRRRSAETRQTHRKAAHVLLFAVLLLDLLRVHWDHFYLFPTSFYREPPRTAAVLDPGTRAFWRVSHYLEYPGLEMWRMHNDPLAAMPLFEREKDAFSFGIHAVFGYRHTGAHLPLVWHWEEGLGVGGRSGRYFFSNRDLEGYGDDSLAPLGHFGEVRAYEVKAWKPRLERIAAASGDRDKGAVATADSGRGAAASADQGPGADAPADSGRGAAASADRGPGAASSVGTPAGATSEDVTACPPGQSGYGGLCVDEIRDGRLIVEGAFAPGDTLLFREHAYPGWIHRIDNGSWERTPETRAHFLAVPMATAARRVELAYVPYDFYRWTGVGAIATGLIAIFAVFRRRKKLSLADTRA